MLLGVLATALIFVITPCVADDARRVCAERLLFTE